MVVSSASLMTVRPTIPGTYMITDSFIAGVLHFFETFDAVGWRDDALQRGWTRAHIAKGLEDEPLMIPQKQDTLIASQNPENDGVISSGD